LSLGSTPPGVRCGKLAMEQALDEKHEHGWGECGANAINALKLSGTPVSD